MFRRFPALGLSVGVLMAASTLALSAPAHASPAPPRAAPATPVGEQIGFYASAYGTSAKVGSAVRSGQSALALLGCTTTVGTTNVNTAAGINLSPLITSGTAETQASSFSTKSFAGVASRGLSTTQGVSLLGGLVTASAVTSESTTNHVRSTNAFYVSSAGTTFVGLSILGVPIAATAPANTRINLPGVGYVILNQQSSSVGATSAGLTVTGLDIVVNAPGVPGVPVGTQITVSHASSNLGGRVLGLVGGYSYGTYAQVGDVVKAGTTFPKYISCFGTNGRTEANTGANLSLPPVVTSGTIKDTVEGYANQTQLSVHTASTAEGLNLLNGTVTATTITSNATATGSPPKLTSGTTFVALKVLGQPVTVTSAKKISLPNIGTLYLDRVERSATSIQVFAIHLVVGTNNRNLPVGAIVNVAVSDASTTP